MGDRMAAIPAVFGDQEMAPDVAEPLDYAYGRLRQYDLWLKRLPPVSAIERIAADLGLPARAAIGTGGNVRAGSIARAIELIRAAQSTLSSLVMGVTRATILPIIICCLRISCRTCAADGRWFRGSGPLSM